LLGVEGDVELEDVDDRLTEDPEDPALHVGFDERVHLEGSRPRELATMFT
jgi:hypothetical protein